MATTAPRWNHNLHFHRRVLAAVPPGARSALDVGTGDGLLARDLLAVLPDVTAIDVDRDVLRRAALGAPAIEWVHGDVMGHEFHRTFDLVASIAVLHHLPEPRAALQRLAALTAPGGVLVVVGLAEDGSVGDRLLGVLGALEHRWYSATRSWWDHSAPTSWPPPHTYREVREAAAEVLPGVRWRRSPLWRYVLTWSRPRA